MILYQNNLWWKQYRRIYRKTKKIDKEKLFRSSLKTVFKEYLQNSSLPGMRYLADPHVRKIEKLCWLVALNMMCAVVIINMHSVWTGVLANPLIVSMESNIYPVEYLDFPAIAFCNVNRISKRAAKAYAYQIKDFFPYLPLRKLENYMEQFGRLIDFEMMGSAELLSFIDQIPVERQIDVDIISTMNLLAPQCEDFIKKCSWKGEIVPCNSLFSTRRTAHGHCCVFNYLMDWDSYGNPVENKGEAQKQGVPGLLYGLNVVLDPEIEDYAYPLHNIEGADILIFDSNHYPDHNNGLLIHRIAEINEAILIPVESRTQIATKEVRKYSLETRKCMFKDEFPSDFDNMYTYSSCIISCRIKTMQSLCKCTPFYLPVTTNSTPICNWSDLYCLQKYREKFLYLYPIDPETIEGLDVEMQDSLYCPQCYPDCEYTRHFTRSATSPIFDKTYKDIPYFLTEGLNMTNKCFVSIFRPTPDGTLDKLDVVSYWYEIVSNFGGTASLLAGYSIITTIELIYYVIIHFWVILLQNIKMLEQNY